MASHHHDDVVRLIAVPDTPEAYAIASALDAEGIYCRVIGSELDAGLGTASVIPAEVWVRKPDLQKAQAALAGFKKNRP
jgi:hypothetical protein